MHLWPLYTNTCRNIFRLAGRGGGGVVVVVVGVGSESYGLDS